MPPASAPTFKLYAITDRKLCFPQPLQAVIGELLDAGVRGFQLREKDLSAKELLELALPIVALCHSCDAQILINSRVEVAVDSGADGVHLPAAAAPVGGIRERSGRPLLVGSSAHSLEEARRRERQGADFLILSPVYTPSGKPEYGPALGPERFRRIRAALRIPVFALGGIGPRQVRECLISGAHGVAVMSGLMQAAGRGARAREYLEQLHAREGRVRA